MDAASLLKLALGLALLLGGAEALVRGASRASLALGVPPLLVGLTVVAYGTSAPELAVSLGSALEGEADLAVGNVVGSNIFNVLLILGLSAAVAPLVVGWRLLRLDVPIMVGVSLLLFALTADGRLARGEAALLVMGAVGYTAFCVARSRGAPPERELLEAVPVGRGARAWAVHAGFVLGGLALLVLGARWLVEGAVAVARAFGVSELVIGLTVVAGGTSLPEAATSVIATLRGEREIAVGNVVGSNIFNVLVVLGATALAAPGGLAVAPAVRSFDLPVMVAVAVACLPIFFTGHAIARWEGLLFLGYFLAYVAYVVLAATRHDALEPFAAVMLEFVLPLTGITLAVVTLRALRARLRRRQRRPGEAEEERSA